LKGCPLYVKIAQAIQIRHRSSYVTRQNITNGQFVMKYMGLKLVFCLVVSLFLSLTGLGWAQELNKPPQSSLAPPSGSNPPRALPSLPPQPGVFERESLHLNTIGTYSAGFVLQSYGYIGVLADVLSQKVYDSEMVSSMLGETVTFLKNANQQLNLYQDKSLQISQADQQFINGISQIIKELTIEAEALSDFAKSHNQADLDRFEASRKQAWAGIKKTLGVN
jgi:hypothetical protein